MLQSPRLDCPALSLIDRHMPRYHFSERHHIRLRVSPDEAIRAAIDPDRPPDRLSALLLILRSVPSRLLGRDAPRIGIHIFTPLGQDGKSETISGLIGRFWQLDGGLVPIADADAFASFAEPGTPKLVTGFRATPDPLGALLTTETRIFCPDLHSLLRFAPYWILIRLPSGLIRRRTLRAIKAAAEKRAESSPPAVRRWALPFPLRRAGVPRLPAMPGVSHVRMELNDEN